MGIKAPDTITTKRLILRRPSFDDANGIFEGWAGDPEATKYMCWPRHESVKDTLQFLQSSSLEWGRWPCGPYLVELRQPREIPRKWRRPALSYQPLIGSTGLIFSSPTQATVGYIFGVEFWGQGYATEALLAMVTLAKEIGIKELSAAVHPKNLASQYVLEKCGFMRSETQKASNRFPNSGQVQPIETGVWVLFP